MATVELRILADSAADMQTEIARLAASFHDLENTSDVYNPPPAEPVAHTAKAAIANADQPQGVVYAPPPAAGQGTDDTRPVRGKNAERLANELKDRLSAAETVEALDRVWGTSKADLFRLPKKHADDVEDHWRACREALGDPASPPAEPAPAEPKTTGKGYTLVNKSGDVIGTFETGREAMETLVGGVETGQRDGQVTEAGMLALLDANRDLIDRIGREDAALADEMNTRWWAVLNAVRVPAGGGTDTPADTVQAEAPAPSAQPAEAEGDTTFEDCRAALEACLTSISFNEAHARMTRLGYSALTDLPAEEEKRAEFVRVMREGTA